MKLFTKAIETKAQARFHLGSEMEKKVIVAKFFNPNGFGSCSFGFGEFVF